MKTNSKSNWKKYLSLAAAMFTASSLAHAGEGSATGGGRGGHDVEQDFARAQEAALNVLEPKAGQFEIDMKSLRATWDAVRVHATNEDLQIQSSPKVAISEPASKTTRVNIERWREVKFERRKEALALHELLVIADKETTGSYRITAKVFNIDSSMLDSNSPLALIENGATFTTARSANSVARKMRITKSSRRDAAFVTFEDGLILPLALTPKGLLQLSEQNTKMLTLFPNCNQGASFDLDILPDGSLMMENISCSFCTMQFKGMVSGPSGERLPHHECEPMKTTYPDQTLKQVSILPKPVAAGCAATVTFNELSKPKHVALIEKLLREERGYNLVGTEKEAPMKIAIQSSKTITQDLSTDGYVDIVVYPAFEELMSNTYDSGLSVKTTLARGQGFADDRFIRGVKWEDAIRRAVKELAPCSQALSKMPSL